MVGMLFVERDAPFQFGPTTCCISVWPHHLLLCPFWLTCSSKLFCFVEWYLLPFNCYLGDVFLCCFILASLYWKFSNVTMSVSRWHTQTWAFHFRCVLTGQRKWLLTQVVLAHYQCPPRSQWLLEAAVLTLSVSIIKLVRARPYHFHINYY